jgi:acyl-CoA synthetase (AMP-forming)/AMP-acid ligase II
MIVHSPYPDPDIPEVSLTEYLLKRAAGFGERTALIDGAGDRRWTYAELGRVVRATAAGLAAHGLRKGDVLALCLPNLPEFVIGFHATIAAGGVVTTVSPLATDREAAAQLRHSRTRWLLTTPALAERLSETLASPGLLEVFTVGGGSIGTDFSSLALEQPGAEDTRVDIAPDDAAAILYSSGTTGLPKGVVLTHRSLVAGLACMERPAGVSTADTALSACPLYHISGLQVEMNLDLASGATLVTMPRFELATFLQLIERYRVTRIVVAPPMVLALAGSAEVDGYDVSSLRVLTSGGAPLSADVARACAARIGCRVSQGYGMTESGAVSLAPRDGADRPESVGPPAPGMVFRIVDIESRADVASGATGELLVRSPSRMREYLDDPAATVATIDSDGWLHTGDIVRIDDDGWLHVVDRIKELIKYKARQVAPAELEAVLLAHPAVADVAVIPSPDPLSGEVPKAFVVPRVPVDVRELLEHVAGQVAPYKKVRRLELIDSIPRSASGKILRRVLVERERAAVAAAPLQGAA